MGKWERTDWNSHTAFTVQGIKTNKTNEKKQNVLAILGTKHKSEQKKQQAN